MLCNLLIYLQYIEEEGSSLDTAVTRVLLNWNVGISVVLKELTNKATSTFGKSSSQPWQPGPLDVLHIPCFVFI